MNTTNTPAFTIPAQIPTRVQQIDTLLGGDTVLLPIAQGCKAPTFKGWQRITVGAMRDLDYLARFSGSNIGVLLGKPTAAVIDSQSVKSDGHGGPVGYDAGKRIKG